MLSFLSADCRTSVKMSSEVPTRTRKSFMLHGWAGRHQGGTASACARGSRLLNWKTPHSQLMYMFPHFLNGARFEKRSRSRKPLTFPKVIPSSTRLARNVLPGRDKEEETGLN